MRVIVAALAVTLSCPILAQPRAVTLTFVPQSPHADAAAQYEAMWATDGVRILETLQRISGLTFTEPAIEAVVFEGVSHSGSVGAPMKLRASYPADVKKATLIHELGHRLNAEVRFYLGTTPELDDHRVLYLYLYDTWVALYGQRFAEAQVEIERHRTVPAAFRWLAGYDYRAAWRWALGMSAEERAAKLREVRRHNDEARRRILRRPA